MMNLTKTLLLTLLFLGGSFLFYGEIFACTDELGNPKTCPTGYTTGCFDELGSQVICRRAQDNADRTAQANQNGSDGSITIFNPLGKQTLLGFFQDILSVLLIFAVPLIVFFIIYAGFKYVMAQGKPEEIQTAGKALLYAIIGGLIILGANIILAVIEGTINAFVV